MFSLFCTLFRREWDLKKKKTTHAVSSGVCGVWGISVVCLLRCFTANEKIGENNWRNLRNEKTTYVIVRIVIDASSSLSACTIIFVRRTWQWILITEENWASLLGTSFKYVYWYSRSAAKIRIAERKRNHVTLNEAKLCTRIERRKKRKEHNRILAYSTIIRGRRKKIKEFLWR